MAGEEEWETLEYTPTWVVAGVCTVIVAISLAAERLLHYLGTVLKKKHQKPLFEALQKVKEELMLLGFISLLLTVFQSAISKMCVPKDAVKSMLPCRVSDKGEAVEGSNISTTSHFQSSLASNFAGGTRRLLAADTTSDIGYCAKKNKVPLLSVEALHHLHIFIFVLAIVHVTFCVITVLFGGARIRQWKLWEDSIGKEEFHTEKGKVPKKTVTHVSQHAFIREHFGAIGKDSAILGWLVSCCIISDTNVMLSLYIYIN
ncbi:hypothetical protein SLEP1_g54171 [Rubroshorea leprosula]|uniref:MLO-like protein 1 n=1 Tax=Rubroshorea leprosula TaxID=152421 RepID=A0AAV5MBK7_9ROSI|nr:hypothetical protein SLEP1_g54171 [Rubroshorea leprosula]